MYKQNLHIHTKYCDGKDTPEEMIIEACEKGFRSIGFSMHSFMSSSQLPRNRIEDYKHEIVALRKKYADKIDIYCGLEREMRDNTDLSGFDYVIGAVHYFHIADKFVGFDRDSQEVKRIIESYFDGDGMAYARAYYEEVASLPQYGKFDIIAHFDLITKHCEKESLFDQKSKEYQRIAVESAEQLVGKIPYFEINTGAMARGYRTTPYPDLFLVKELKRLGFGAVISTDCHDRRNLDYGYEEAMELLKKCGFKERFVFTGEGFIGVEL